MVKNISDKVYRMSIKQQYKYQTVKITVKLGDRFDRSFQNAIWNYCYWSIYKVVRQEINGEREKRKKQMATVDGCIDRT